MWQVGENGEKLSILHVFLTLTQGGATGQTDQAEQCAVCKTLEISFNFDWQLLGTDKCYDFVIGINE